MDRNTASARGTRQEHVAHSTTIYMSEALGRMKRDDARVSRPARRTLAAMVPGAVQRPVLQLAPNVHFLPTAVWGDPDDDACPMCLHWTCICGQDSTAPAGTALKVAA